MTYKKTTPTTGEAYAVLLVSSKGRQFRVSKNRATAVAEEINTGFQRSNTVIPELFHKQPVVAYTGPIATQRKEESAAEAIAGLQGYGELPCSDFFRGKLTKAELKKDSGSHRHAEALHPG